ncbi:MAG: hypothetical protein OES79_09535 [Planctomycetota bacterium]|nr:hypothetical protein [Planctomycetota bacterium]
MKSKALQALRILIAFAPWVIASYLFYWLDSSGTWTSDTPHRGKISVAILASGMLLSFLVHSYFTRRGQK